jgi:hypothetical protein
VLWHKPTRKCDRHTGSSGTGYRGCGVGSARSEMRRTNAFRIEAPDYVGQGSSLLRRSGRKDSLSRCRRLRVVDPRGTVLRVFHVASFSAGGRQPALKLISFSRRYNRDYDCIGLRGSSVREFATDFSLSRVRNVALGVGEYKDDPATLWRPLRVPDDYYHRYTGCRGWDQFMGHQ